MQLVAPTFAYRSHRSYCKPRLLVLAVICCLATGSLSAQTRTDYESFLFPLAPVFGYDLPSPGGRGRLGLAFTAFNPTSITIPYYPEGSACQVTCIGSPKIEPGINFVLPLANNPLGSLGRFLHLARPEGSQVRFQTRLQDVTGPDFGTEVPVIREGDYFTGTVHLLSLPVEARYLTTVRIYDPDAVAPQRFRVRIFENQPGSRLIRELELTTRLFGGSPSLPPFPGYAEISDLRESLTAVTASKRQRATRNAAAAGSAFVRVEIEPVTPGVRFWAFATVASTEVHELTIVTPQ